MKKYLVSLSGGKDSTACLIYMLNNYNKEQIIPYFCDTGWEHPKVYEYLDYLQQELKIKIIKLQDTTMVELVYKKKFFPSSRFRFCTDILKNVPAEKFINKYKNMGYSVVNIVGVRRDESKNRQNQNLWKTVFMGTPPAKYYTKKANKKVYSTRALKRYYSKQNSVITYQPFVYKTALETVKYCLDNSIEINSLYDKGHKRVGCYPCIFADNNDILLLEDWARERLSNLESEISKISKKGKAYFFYGRKGLSSKEIFKKNNMLPQFDLGCVNLYGQCGA